MYLLMSYQCRNFLSQGSLRLSHPSLRPAPHTSLTLFPHTHPSHPSLTPILHTHPSHRSLKLFPHTYPSHPSFTVSPHTHPSLPSPTPIPHTHPSHSSLTPIPHTHPPHSSLTPIPHTHSSHSCIKMGITDCNEVWFVGPKQVIKITYLGIIQHFVQFSQSLQGKDFLDPTHQSLNSYEQ